MRRRYSKKQSPKKQFLNSYHINEVPLPYYNPLADPYLQGFFSNNRNHRHISQMGLIYSSSKEYPYHQRKHINFNKFHRHNHHDVPASHYLKRSGDLSSRGNSSSFKDFMNQNASTRSQLFRRMSAEQLTGREKAKLQFIGDGVSQKPTSNSSSRRGVFSS